MKKDPKLLKIGIVGTIIAALCCFTPILVLFFTVVGLSGVLGYLDYILLPALAFFMLLALYALGRYLRH